MEFTICKLDGCHTPVGKTNTKEWETCRQHHPNRCTAMNKKFKNAKAKRCTDIAKPGETRCWRHKEPS